MKVKIVASAVILSLGLSFQSCKKPKKEIGETSTQTIDVVLDMNKSYQYSFGTPDDDLSITQQSQSFLVSELDEVNESVLFNYTPKTDFVGTDEVQVTLGKVEPDHHKEEHGSKNPIEELIHPKHKKCDKPQMDKTIYIFRFTIKRSIEATSAVVVSNNEK